MVNQYEVIIIGAGASGIMCALNTSKRTLLIEAGNRVGKKILATGNGKCNLTNDDLQAKYYNTNLVEPYFQRFNQVQTLKFFAGLGIYTYTDEAGRRYPLSNSANTVLDLLLKALNQKNNVEVVLNTQPITVSKKQDNFYVITNNQTYVGNKLVIATGGNSGTEYFKNLNVDYQNFKPCLVALKTAKNKYLAGVRVSNVRVKFKDFVEAGEILFKEDGISGIVIFNLSSYLARNNFNAGIINIDLLPNYELNQLLTVLNDSVKQHPGYELEAILEGFLHKSLAKHLLEKLALEHKVAKASTTTDINQIANVIKNFTVKFHGYADNYQVHTGGVDLKDLDQNLQHRTIKNLYLIGEVVNVDGICGGYNLQWAWTSGKIVGDNL